MTNNQKQIAKIFITVIGHGLLVAVPLLMHAYTFSRDLKLGDSGEDVRTLQISLNADAQTRVAESGVGSPGLETAFFGEKTQSAVIRYQNLHAGEILTPLGLTSGTGYVGVATRSRLSGAVVTGDTTKKSFSEAVAAFDAAIGVSTAVETNLSPVDDPRIPKTQDDLIVAVGDFAGVDANPAEIADFSRQMVLARYGYPTNLKSAASGGDDETVPRPQCSDGVNNDPSEDTAVDYPNDRGCTSSQDSTERSGSSGGGSGGGSREDADVDTTGAGCIGMLLSLLGF